MDDGIDTIGKQRARNRAGRIEAGLLLLCTPQFARVDQWPKTVGIPQECLRFTRIEPTIGTEILTPFSQHRLFGEQSADHLA